MTHVELYFPRPSDDVELAELAARARAGSASAFDDLAHRVRGRILAWARGFTGDQDEAEDVAQLVLLRLHDDSLYEPGVPVNRTPVPRPTPRR